MTRENANCPPGPAPVTEDQQSLPATGSVAEGTCANRGDGNGTSGNSLHASSLRLVAYSMVRTDVRLEKAAPQRKWMDATGCGFANRCLPLRIANQAGWFVLGARKIEVTWNGGDDLGDLRIRYYKKTVDEDLSAHPPLVTSHFGHGILTFHIPYLFRTPPGYNLYVRGPANWCKDGVCPLDAIVETDWTVATFTMNWKVTRIGMPIIFGEGEPIAMVFPVPRGDLERFWPEIADIRDQPELEEAHNKWSESRRKFNEELRKQSKPLWQKDYYVGAASAGESSGRHQMKLNLRSFRDNSADGKSAD